MDGQVARPLCNCEICYRGGGQLSGSKRCGRRGKPELGATMTLDKVSMRSVKNVGRESCTRRVA